MPRIRTIKPEFPEDETLGKVSRDARLLFVLIWTRADDLGRFRASPAYLRGQLFPFDEDLTLQMIDQWLDELEGVGRIKSYVVREERYGVVSNWAKHQRVDNAGKPLCPSPPFAEESASLGGSQSEAKPSQTNGTSHGRRPSPTLAESRGGSPLDLDLDLGPRPLRKPAAKSSEGAVQEIPEGGSEEDEDELKSERVTQAASLLARRDLDAAVARGTQVGSRAAWLRTAAAGRIEADGPRLAALHEANPGWTAARLADAVANAGQRPRVPEYVPEGVGQGVGFGQPLKRVDDEDGDP